MPRRTGRLTVTTLSSTIGKPDVQALLKLRGMSAIDLIDMLAQTVKQRMEEP